MQRSLTTNTTGVTPTITEIISCTTTQEIISPTQETSARISISTNSFGMSRTVADELLMEEIHVRL